MIPAWFLQETQDFTGAKVEGPRRTPSRRRLALAEVVRYAGTSNFSVSGVYALTKSARSFGVLINARLELARVLIESR